MPFERIISLVPSITLLLFDLGLENAIAGRTKFCIHPSDKIKRVPTIGGTKNIDLEKIRSFQPDLLIANKEENEKEQVEILQREFNVLITDVSSLEENYSMIEAIGRITNTSIKASRIIEETKRGFASIAKFSPELSALYLIWRKPFMTVGKDTFIHSMLETIGLKNVYGSNTRYPEIADLSSPPASQARIVLLSSEPYPFSGKHIDEIRDQLPGAQIMLADGEYFSWYGSKMMHAPTYFKELISQVNEQLE